MVDLDALIFDNISVLNLKEVEEEGHWAAVKVVPALQAEAVAVCMAVGALEGAAAGSLQLVAWGFLEGRGHPPPTLANRW